MASEFGGAVLGVGDDVTDGAVPSSRIMSCWRYPGDTMPQSFAHHGTDSSAMVPSGCLYLG